MYSDTLNKSATICCRCLLLVLAATQASALTVRPVPQGVISVNRGTAVTQDREYEILIVRQHPASVQHQFLNVLRALRQAIDQYSALNGTLEKVFEERYRFLIDYAKATTIRVKRWAPLEPIGGAVGNFFGLASTSDVNEVKDTVNSVLANMN